MTNSIPDKCRLQQSFWSAMEATGLDPVAVLRQAGLPLTLHLDTRRFVSTAQFFALWSAMSELADDPNYSLRFVQATETVGHQPMFVGAYHLSACPKTPRQPGEAPAPNAWLQRHATLASL